MSCLSKILCGEELVIGVRGLDGCDKPLSNLYLNDLPGISIKKAAGIATEEYESGIRLMREKIKQATQLVFDDFKGYVFPAYALTSVIAEKSLGAENSREAIKYVPFSGYKGISIERSRAPLAKIWVRRIKWLAENAGELTIRITDGPLVTEKKFTVTAKQWNYLDINYKAYYSKVVVDADVTDFKPAFMNVTTPCRTCGSSRPASYLDVDGWDGQRDVNLIYGIDADVQLICDEEELICSVLNRLYYPIYLRSGIEFLAERIHSTRFNMFTLLGQEKAAELRDEMQEKYERKWAEFRESIKSYLGSLSDVCLKCRRNQYVQTTP